MKSKVLHTVMRQQSVGAVRGFSILELLLAMLLGVSLSASVVQVYVGNSQIQREQEARARMQENGRFAIAYLTREIRMAGYFGCLSRLDDKAVNNALDDPPSSFQPELGVQGWEANGTASGVSNVSVNNTAVVSTAGGAWASSGANVLDAISAVPGSDIIRVWRAALTGGTINSIKRGAGATVVNSESVDIDDGDILLLSDCQHADWVQACEVHALASGGRINVLLSSACYPGNRVANSVRTQPGGELARLEGSIFFVAKRAGLATNPPALFRKRLYKNGDWSNAEELVEGVENLQILYGINTDGDNKRSVDAYVTAAQVGDWSQLISVRLSVLVQSITDYMMPAPQAYTFNNVSYDGHVDGAALPADRRLRRAFTTTVTLRNRALGR